MLGFCDSGTKIYTKGLRLHAEPAGYPQRLVWSCSADVLLVLSAGGRRRSGGRHGRAVARRVAGARRPARPARRPPGHAADAARLHAAAAAARPALRLRRGAAAVTPRRALPQTTNLRAALAAAVPRTPNPPRAPRPGGPAPTPHAARPTQQVRRAVVVYIDAPRPVIY